VSQVCCLIDEARRGRHWSVRPVLRHGQRGLSGHCETDVDVSFQDPCRAGLPIKGCIEGKLKENVQHSRCPEPAVTCKTYERKAKIAAVGRWVSMLQHEPAVTLSRAVVAVVVIQLEKQ